MLAALTLVVHLMLGVGGKNVRIKGGRLNLADVRVEVSPLGSQVFRKDASLK